MGGGASFFSASDPTLRAAAAVSLLPCYPAPLADDAHLLINESSLSELISSMLVAFLLLHLTRKLAECIRQEGELFFFCIPRSSLRSGMQ